MSVVLSGSRSTASMVVHWLLVELEVPHTLQLLDSERHEHKSPAYLQLNPAGVVPALVTNGEVVTEAAAIVMHLADLYSQAGLAPALGTIARAQYYRWTLFMANSLQPAYRAWFYPAEPAGEGSEDAVKQQARCQPATAWAGVTDHLASSGRPYLLGEQLSAADFMLTMLTRWSRDMPTPAHALPALQAHAMLMKVRPSFKQVYAREGLTDWT